MVETRMLRHIEGFSPRRVEWLADKIAREGVWSRPIALDRDHYLVLDGQHRMEVGLVLGLKRIPAVKFDYASVRVWSLRPNYSFDWQRVVERALAGEIYPYKTVKHAFPAAIPTCMFKLDELRA